MSYSDIQMIIASQIAYVDFDRSAVESGQYTIHELLEMEAEHAEGDRIEAIRKLQDRISRECPACGEWRLKHVGDDQSASGMYACMLETGDGNALVAFRGSESRNWDDIKKDWILSDLGLLNSVLTPQQAAAERYMDYLYRRYGKEYQSFGITGHSLGGNLAEHAAITAPDGMRGKIAQCVNLDGPGFSQQYLTAHDADIKKSKGILTHYQWSWCGRLLSMVPGSRFQTIQAKTPYKGWNLASMLYRHDTYNVVRFDKNGNAVAAVPDWLSLLTDSIAAVLDYSLFWITGSKFAERYNRMDIKRDGLRNVWEQWNEARILASANARFEVTPGAVDAGLEELSRIVPCLKEIQYNVERIEKELAFDSVAAGYVKLKLWSTVNAIGRDMQKLNEYCEKGRECTAYYRMSEQKIAGEYI